MVIGSTIAPLIQLGSFWWLRPRASPAGARLEHGN
jgi:hypothetical protein